jgi:hypothetical protein
VVGWRAASSRLTRALWAASREPTPDNARRAGSGRLLGIMGALRVLGVGLLACVSCGGSRFGAEQESETLAGSAGDPVASGSSGKGGETVATGGSSSRSGGGGTSSVGGSGGANNTGGSDAGTAGLGGSGSGAGGIGGDEPGSAGEAGGATISAGTGGAVPVGGSAGTGGAQCVPLGRDEACGSDECGTRDDGCGTEVFCGQCDESREDCLAGQCVERCDCSNFECGRLDTCSTPALCGPLAGECGTFELCLLNTLDRPQEGAACHEPGFQMCTAHRPGQQETCCSVKTEECWVGYSNCPGLFAVSLATGEPCGSCMTGDIEHHCGPGY